jgi:hypothetical protein
MISKKPKLVMLAAVLVVLVLMLCNCERPDPTPIEGTVRPVVILVIDDFEPKGGLDWGPNDKCLVTPNGVMHHKATGTGVYAGGGATRGYIEQSHGRLVYSELQTLLLVHGGRKRGATVGVCDDVLSCAPPYGYWWHGADLWWTDAGYIILVAVDTEGFSTETIAPRIERTVSLFNDPDETSLLAQEWDIKGEIKPRGFVLNMSFAIVPCDPGTDKATDQLYNDYRSYIDSEPELESLRKELASLVDPTTGLFLDQAKARESLLYGPTFGPFRMYEAYVKNPDFSESVKDGFSGEDPLFKLLQDYKDGLRLTGEGGFVISVGAAGNSHFNFPFAPALWDSVVSVSSLGTDDVNKAAYSNSGEVAMDGVFALDAIKIDQVPIEGTTFAVSKLSLLAARYLLTEGKVPCDNIAPPLAYAQTLTDKPNDERWLNLSLKNATLKYCSDFPVDW